MPSSCGGGAAGHSHASKTLSLQNIRLASLFLSVLSSSTAIRQWVVLAVLDRYGIIVAVLVDERVIVWLVVDALFLQGVVLALLLQILNIKVQLTSPELRSELRSRIFENVCVSKK